MKTKFFLVIIFLMALICKAQPDIAWQENYGGLGNDFAYAIVQTNDGGYAMAGYALTDGGDVSEHNGQRDFWVVKTDDEGVIQWEKAYGGSSAEIAYSIQQTSDNGYIVTGLTSSVNGDITENFGYDDIWVIKLDASGNLEWQKSYGDADTERAWEILQTTDGGYVLTGYSWINTSHRDFIVIKLDASGNLEWQNIFGFYESGGGSNNEAHSIKQTSDGGYIVAGHTLVLEGMLNTASYWVVKLNALGEIEWNNRYGGTNIDVAWHVQQTTDNGYIVVGHSYSNDEDVTGNHGMEDIWVIKLDTNGNLQWEKSLGGSQRDRAFCVIQMSDGNYLVAGFTDSTDGDVTNNQGSYDGWLIKLNTSGDIIWQKTVGGSDYEILRSVVQTADGGFAVTGRIDSNDTPAGILQGDGDFWLVKFEAEILSTNNSNLLKNSIAIYPNPVSNILNISTKKQIESVKMYDVLGKLVFESSAINQINVSDYKSGVYLVKLESNDNVITKKIIIE